MNCSPAPRSGQHSQCYFYGLRGETEEPCRRGSLTVMVLWARGVGRACDSGAGARVVVVRAWLMHEGGTHLGVLCGSSFGDGGGDGCGGGGWMTWSGPLRQAGHWALVGPERGCGRTCGHDRPGCRQEKGDTGVAGRLCLSRPPNGTPVVPCCC